MTPLLAVEDLNVWFDLESGRRVHAVRDVSLELAQEGKLGLVGESGCGKSTTILAMMGLLPSNATLSGRVVLDGVDILAGGERTVRPHRWVDIAMVFQGAMNAFNPVRRVSLQIAEAMAVRRGLSREKARRRAGELLELVGIPRERLDAYPHEFSGGMRQRAAIALALSCEPRILLADEPTTALDAIVQAQIMELLSELCREQGLAMILVSHDLALVLHLCEQMQVMYAGETIESGPSGALVEDPAHPYTRLLFAATPEIFEDAELVSIPGAPPPLDVSIAGCPFRPRCDRAFTRCSTEAPAFKPIRADRYAACHLNDEPELGLGRSAQRSIGGVDGPA